MKLILSFLFLSCFGALQLLAQSENDSFEQNWTSEGVPPTSLLAVLNTTPKFISYPIGNISNFNLASENPIFDRIYCSGRIIYGNSNFGFSKLKQKLIQKGVLKAEDEIYAIKSNETAVIGSKNIFLITTGLLSQATNWENIAFLLIREQKKNEIVSNQEVYTFSRCLSLDNLIVKYATFSKETEKKIDKAAFLTFMEKGFSAGDAFRAMDVLRFSDSPFIDKRVPPSYFSRKDLYIPSSFLDVSDLGGAEKTNNQFGAKTVKVELQERKTLLQDLHQGDKARTEATIDFLAIQKVSRYQIIEEQIISNQYESALYSTFLLTEENNNLEKIFLDKMNAHAWYGLLRSKFSYDTKRYASKAIINNQSESDRFFRILKKLNSYGVAGLGLRYVTDIANNNPELKNEVLILREEMVRLLASSSRFPIEKYSSSPFISLEKNQLDATDSKYDKIDKSASTETISSDTNEFYFYAIPDLISDSTFRKSFEQGESLTTEKAQTAPRLLFADVYKFNKKGLQELKSKSIKEDILKDVDYISKKSKTGVYNGTGIGIS